MKERSDERREMRNADDTCDVEMKLTMYTKIHELLGLQNQM